MATILGRITINHVDLCEVDADPAAAGGTVAALGTVAINSSTAAMYSKTGPLPTDWTLVATGSPGGVQTTFVFQPGGVATDNVYTDWGLLMTDLTAVSGPKWLEFDNRFGAVTIPAGGPYDMRDTILMGRKVSGTPIPVTVSAGASFVNLERLEWCTFFWSGAAPAMVVPAGISYFRMWGAAIDRTGGTAPFFDVTTPGAVLLTQFANASGFNPTGSGVVVELGGTGVMSFALDEASNNGVDTVGGTPGSSIVFALRDPSARYNPITGPTFTGALSGPTLVGIASNLEYDDSATAPPIVGGGSSNVQAAIDALKNRPLRLDDSIITGDATPTVITTIPTAADSALSVRTTVVGRTAGGDSAVYVRTAHAEVAAGTPSVLAVSTDFTSEDVAAWDATITVTGGALVVEVTGSPTVITWRAATEVMEVI